MLVNSVSFALVLRLWKLVMKTNTKRPAVIAPDSIEVTSRRIMPGNNPNPGHETNLAIQSIRNTTQQKRKPYAGIDPREFSTTPSKGRSPCSLLMRSHEEKSGKQQRYCPHTNCIQR